MTRKAFAYIVRVRESTPELLVFVQEMQREVQVPKGTMEPDETPEQAVLREVFEESGPQNISIVEKLGITSCTVKSGALMNGLSEAQQHHFFLLKPNDELPDTWSHHVTGSGLDGGMQFNYRWITIESSSLSQLCDGCDQFTSELLKRFAK